MSTINTMEDLIQVLDEHPEWLEALRARLLSRELLDLPHNFAMFVTEMREFKSEMNEFKAQVDRFVAATNSRFDGVDARLDKVDARFDGVDARFDGVDARLDKVDARLDKVDARFDGVDARLDKVDARLDGHDAMFKRITDDLGQLKGAHARNAALENAAIIARDLGLRRTKSLSREELLDLIDASDTVGITVDDLRSFRVADLIMEAAAEDEEICYVAVEISYTANGRDTQRAIRNAEFMTRFTGKRSFAVVSGLYRDDRIQESIESGELCWHQLTPEQLEAE
ncbi:MAG: hypothetical protein OXH73_01580 [Caldilineaceae bacterium]|nr:hypothetical protein [Caldilineaceae bacterium]